MSIAVPHLRIGHASTGRTGCTVLLGPFRAVALPLGGATGARELNTLAPTHLVEKADALLLTGGGAFGLAAADGVVAWLEERGQGFDTRVARVPIVPAAVIFDLTEADPRHRPGPDLARQACDAARAAVPAEGRVGAGTGASVGKVLGPAGAAAGGFGYVAERFGEWVVAACVVVNAFGDVLDDSGRILAGARRPDGTLVDTAAMLRSGTAPGSFADAVVGASTTLAVVATDAPLSRTDLLRVAHGAAAGLARRISPVFTPFDGDLLFAVSTGGEERPADAPQLLALGALADHLLAAAIQRAVTAPAA